LHTQLDLDALKLGLNDLLPVARTWDGPFKEFTDFIEHAVFYARSPQANSINNPKSWIVSQLRKRYYAVPTGFVSWLDQQAEAKVRSRQQQAARRHKLRMQGLQADFELWLDTLKQPERQATFANAGDLNPEFVTPPMRMQMLRERFAKLRDVPEFALVQPSEDQ
jgi:hypothetical protein